MCEETERERKGHHLTWASQHDVEVQTVNTDRRIVLDTQVDVLLDTESEVAAG